MTPPVAGTSIPTPPGKKPPAGNDGKPEPPEDRNKPSFDIAKDPNIKQPKTKDQILEPVFNLIRTWIAPITSWGSLITGIGSFGLANFREQNDFVDKLATGFSKGSLFITGLYGVLENAFNKKNFFGALGYACDITTSVFVPPEKMYYFRLFGTSLDQIPAMLEDVGAKYATLVKNKFGNNSNFVEFLNFKDNIEKTIFGSKLVIQETFKDLKEKYKSKGFLAAIGEFFNKKRADVNIFTSSVGVLASGFIGSILGFEKTGRTLRDLFGFHADYGVGIKAYSMDETGKPTGGGNQEYGLAGLLYGLAGLLDLGSIWLPYPNLHFASLGIDRFSARKMVDAQSAGDEKKDLLV